MAILLINTIGIVTRLDIKEVFSLVESVEAHLQERGIKIILESTLAKLGKLSSPATHLNKLKADLIVSIGGDGTLLKTCLYIPRAETPILAVNMGRRGFLTEVDPQEILPAIDRCIKGDYILERYIKLSSVAGRKKLPDALNELLIASTSLSKVMGLRIIKDGLPVAECYCDGLIIATPTGSTAHSLSAGGSVLDPKLEAFILTPICPIVPTPPIVFSSMNRIQIQLIKIKNKARVSIDGQYQTSISRSQTITIKKSKHYASIIRFSKNFYNRLRRRFPLAIAE